MNRLVKTYLLFMPWTSALAISSWLYLPGIMLVSILPLLLIRLSISYKFKFNGIDLGLIALLVAVLVSSILAGLLHFNWKSINHTMAYIFTVFIWYFVPRVLLDLSNLSLGIIFSWIKLSLFVVGLIGLLEFILKNYYAFDIDSFIYRPLSMTDYIPTFGPWIRVRSVVEESGHLSLLMEIFIPLIVFGESSRNMKSGIIFYLVMGLCFILTFSTVGYVLLALNIFILVMIRLKESVWSGLTVIILVVCSVFYYWDALINLYVDLVGNKLISNSGSRRLDSILAALNFMREGNIIHILFGYGPGSYDVLGLDSVVSLYVNLFLELGLVGALIFGFILFKVYVVIRSIRSKNLRIGLLLSFFNAVIHYIFIGNYWYPWIWLLFVLIMTIKRNEINYQNEYEYISGYK